MCEAVRVDDFDRFLKLVLACGHSSFEYNQNAYSIQAPDQQGIPLALAVSQRVLEGRGAWRLQGGGFAGTIQAFVPLDLLELPRRHRRRLWPRQLPRSHRAEFRRGGGHRNDVTRYKKRSAGVQAVFFIFAQRSETFPSSRTFTQVKGP